jgi:hypothetical protein
MSVASAFSEALRIALDRLAEDEWAVVRARDAATQGLSPSDAFASIVEVLDLATKQNDSYAFASCCWVALALAKRSSTTERPKGLETTLARAEGQAQTLGCTVELAEVRAWFRIAA